MLTPPPRGRFLYYGRATSVLQSGEFGLNLSRGQFLHYGRGQFLYYGRTTSALQSDEFGLNLSRDEFL